MFFKSWNTRLKLITLLMLLSINNIVYAQDNNENDLNFSVKPIVCIVERLGEPCQMKAKFSWQVNQLNVQVCIWQDFNQLFCEQNTAAKQQKYWLVELKKSTLFSLKVAGEIIAEQQVEVAGLQPPQYRRRLHSDWSLF